MKDLTRAVVFGLAMSSVFNMVLAKQEVTGGLSLAELFELKVGLGSNIEGLSLDKIPAKITVISREEIKTTGARNLPELVTKLVPGAMAIHDADDLIYAFRGFAPDNNSTVLMLINGQNVNFEYNQGSSVLMAVLNLTFIERVEVLTGPGSVVFGSGPLLGVINIVTADFQENGESSVSFGYDYGNELTSRNLDLDDRIKGGFNNLYSSVRHVGEEVKFFGSMGIFAHQNGYVPLESKGNLPNSDPSQPDLTDFEISGSTLEDNAYHETLPGHAFFGLLEWEGLKLSMHSTKHQFDKYDDARTATSDYETRGGRAEYDFEATDHVKVVPSVSYQLARLDLGRNRLNPASTNRYPSETKVGGRLVGQYKFDKLSAALGGDATHYTWEDAANWRYWGDDPPTLWSADRQDSLVPEQRGFTQFTGEGDALDYGFFAEGLLSIMDELSVMAAGRMSYSDWMDEFNPSLRIALMGSFASGFWYKAFVANAFRTPIPVAVDWDGIEHPYGTHFRHYLNPSLKTQSLTSIEAHAGYGKDSFDAKLISFYSINDRIIIAGGPAQFAPVLGGGFDAATDVAKYWWTFANAAKITTIGFEPEVTLMPMEKLKFGVSHSIVIPIEAEIDPVLKENNTEIYIDTPGEHLFNYPMNVTKCHAAFSGIRNLSLRTDFLLDYGRYRTDLSDDGRGNPISSGRTKKLDQWYNLDFGAVYTVMKRLDLSLHFYNIFNSQPYQPIVHQLYVSTPYPRFVKAGVELKF